MAATGGRPTALLVGFAARGQLTQDGAEAALTRALQTYLGWLAFADRLFEADDVHRLHASTPAVEPPPVVAAEIRRDPLAWFNFERGVLFQLLHQAHAAGLNEYVWRMAERMGAYAESRVQWDDWQQALNMAFAASRRAGDQEQEARALFRIGDSLMIQERLAEAADYFRRCQTASRSSCGRITDS